MDIYWSCKVGTNQSRSIWCQCHLMRGQYISPTSSYPYLPNVKNPSIYHYFPLSLVLSLFLSPFISPSLYPCPLSTPLSLPFSLLLYLSFFLLSFSRSPSLPLSLSFSLQPVDHLFSQTYFNFHWLCFKRVSNRVLIKSTHDSAVSFRSHPTKAQSYSALLISDHMTIWALKVSKPL